MITAAKFKNFAVSLIFWLLVLWFIVYIFWPFGGGSDLVKPCEGMSDDMVKECFDYYLGSGWTWDEIKNGILVTNK
jgi:hypothetical protein